MLLLAICPLTAVDIDVELESLDLDGVPEVEWMCALCSASNAAANAVLFVYLSLFTI
jgi:hypothetical protein